MVGYHFSHLINLILLMVFFVRVAKIRIPNDVKFLFLFFSFLIKTGYVLQLSFPVRKIRSVL